MTNIAFTTLVLLVLSLPGYLAQAGYYSREFTKQVLPQSLLNDIARSIIISLPFHLLGLTLVESWQHAGWIKTDLNFEIVLRLLSGHYENRFTDVINRLYGNKEKIVMYYVLLSVGAFLTGHALRHIVWHRQMDVRYPSVFGYRNLWLYRLTGRGKFPPDQEPVPYVDALVDLGEKTRLYRGVVWDFAVDDTGNLQDLFLIKALRGKFTMREGATAEFSWQQIPGDFLVLRYSEIKNLNVSYFVPQAVEEQPPAPQIPPQRPAGSAAGTGEPSPDSPSPRSSTS